MTDKKIKKKTSESFPKEFIEKVKNGLLADKERLENDLGKFAKKDPTAPGGFTSSFPNYGDKDDENAAEVADYQIRISLEENLEKALRDADKALDKIKKDTYGICNYCGNAIEQKRLEARHASTSCTTCKQAIKQEV
jgi:DnaK suppressor protein